MFKAYLNGEQIERKLSETVKFINQGVMIVVDESDPVGGGYSFYHWVFVMIVNNRFCLNLIKIIGNNTK